MNSVGSFRLCPLYYFITHNSRSPLRDGRCHVLLALFLPLMETCIFNDQVHSGKFFRADKIRKIMTNQ